MTLGGYERKQPWPNLICRHGICLKVPRKTAETLSILCALAEIQTRHFPNRSQKLYCLGHIILSAVTVNLLLFYSVLCAYGHQLCTLA
jgi:hypothetical protein